MAQQDPETELPCDGRDQVDFRVSLVSDPPADRSPSREGEGVGAVKIAELVDIGRDAEDPDITAFLDEIVFLAARVIHIHVFVGPNRIYPTGHEDQKQCQQPGFMEFHSSPHTPVPKIRRKQAKLPQALLEPYFT